MNNNHQECWFGRHLALGRRRYAKPIVSNCPKKYIKAICFWDTILKVKILICLILFQLLNFHLWLAAQSTLHTAQCTLRTLPAPANAPETESVRFILHIEHFALNAIYLYSMLNIYHFTLKHPKFAWVTLKMYMAKWTVI